MSVWVPTAAERASLEFSFGKMPFFGRYVLAGALFALGAWVWFRFTAAPVLGLFIVLLGHLPLWVKKQRLAPGGATPEHEDVWAPVDPDWYDRVVRLEREGTRWDTSPWDITNATGCMTMVFVLVAVGVVAVASFHGGSSEGLPPASLFAVALFVPLWLNGRRYNWHASELRLKGRALGVAARCAEETAGAQLEPVPLLALREGTKGKYPVDARLMLRPVGGGHEAFLGVQVQVSLNTVRGVRYPYLYCVVLAKEGFRFPELPEVSGLVVEQESNEGVTYVVVRQYADNSGGWSTKDDDIARIVAAALDLGLRCL